MKHKKGLSGMELECKLYVLLTKEFIGDENRQAKALKIVDIEWGAQTNGQNGFKEIPGTTREIPCDLALLAVGFMHPQYEGMLEQLGVEIDACGNVVDENYQTNFDKIFSAGDMRRGQSLVVWAIAEGREAAISIDRYLTEK